jgi:hypothetical protein
MISKQVFGGLPREVQVAMEDAAAEEYADFAEQNLLEGTRRPAMR